MQDPNTNPAWDAVLGEDTEAAVMRLLGLLAAFVILSGTLFWLVAERNEAFAAPFLCRSTGKDME